MNFQHLQEVLEKNHSVTERLMSAYKSPQKLNRSKIPLEINGSYTGEKPLA